MKFPISVLPATVCVKEFFNHLCMMAITFVMLLLFGYYPSIHWLGLIYYAVCSFLFVEALALVTSVLIHDLERCQEVGHLTDADVDVFISCSVACYFLGHPGYVFYHEIKSGVLYRYWI